jgi:methylated-DNA-[protein]-cysteine S-methyltransferase
MKTFADKVRDIVRKIPKGKTLTYKEVARKAGKPGAARAVGGIMKKNFDSKIPCHRVIRSDGGMGGYNRGGIEKKKAILKAEALSVKKNNRA